MEDRGPRDLVVAQGGFVYVRLERRSRLARREHDVELAPDLVVAVIGRADPGPYLAGLGISGQQRGVVDVESAEVLHAVGDSRGGNLLEVQVERGAHDDAALLHRGGAEQLFQVDEHVVDEMGRLALPRGRLDVEL